MTDVQRATRYPMPRGVQVLDIAAKTALVLLLAMALINPQAGNLEGKAAEARAIGYPMLAFSVPLIWHVFWRDRASFPWLADLLVTVTCFTDVFGNRLDLYDSIWWFDDWMHLMNTGLLAAAVILLTMHRSAPLMAILERALAVGATGAIAWELAEYVAFISKGTERTFAYTDTLGDLTLGTLGAIVAAFVIRSMWKQGRLLHTAPQLEPVPSAALP